MASSAAARSTLWPQVWGLAAVQGTISLTWVIYNLYLPKLLTQFGFSAAVATGVVVIENLLSAGMEPLMGSLCDRTQHWLGSRFPFIAIGVILASACFIGIPLFVLWGNPASRWVLPVLLIAWALAMTVFRSPALSLLGRYAINTQLPKAAAVLTLVGSVAAAMGPLASTLILSLGPVVTFAVGSISMLLAATLLRLTGPDQQVQPPPPVGFSAPPPPTSQDAVQLAATWTRGDWRCKTLRLGLVFASGAAVGLGFRLVMQALSQILKVQVASANISIILGCLFLTLSLMAVPAGRLATRLGNRTAMVGAAIGMAILIGLMPTIHHLITAFILTIALGATFSLLANGAIPFALAMVPAAQAGWGTGLYFGGGALATSIFGVLFNPATAWSASLTIVLGMGVFLIASLLIAASYRLPNLAQL